MRYLMTSKEDATKMPHPQRRLLIAGRIKEARLHSGLSQRDVAQSLHIGASTYSRLERGVSEISAAQVATLSGLYGISALWFMGIPSYVVNAVQSSSSSS